MKKGEFMRQSILDTAEKLFFERGYDNTSVQDILDVLGLSKGGFYHHFPSKEAVLTEICLTRISDNLQAVRASLDDARLTPIERMNRVLEGLNLLSGGNVSFAALAVKICYVNDDPVIRLRLRALMIAELKPLFDEALAAGLADESFFTRIPGRLADIALNLAADTDDYSYRELAEQGEQPEYILKVLDALDAGRQALELLLGAPYGSIRLFDPDKLLDAYRGAAAELNALEGRK